MFYLEGINVSIIMEIVNKKLEEYNVQRACKL